MHHYFSVTPPPPQIPLSPAERFLPLLNPLASSVKLAGNGMFLLFCLSDTKENKVLSMKRHYKLRQRGLLDEKHVSLGEQVFQPVSRDTGNNTENIQPLVNALKKLMRNVEKSLCTNMTAMTSLKNHLIESIV